MPSAQRIALVAAVLAWCVHGVDAFAAPPAASASAPQAAAPVAPAPAVPAPAASAPAAPAPAPAPVVQAKGAVVVAAGSGASPAAKGLAQALYGDARLRPRLDERTARLLAGSAGAESDDARQREIAAVVRTLGSNQEPLVRRKLIAGLGNDLHAELVVVVEQEANAARARVMRTRDGRFMAVSLQPKGDATQPASWTDAKALLRGLLTGPPPGPRRVAPPKPNGQPSPLAPKLGGTDPGELADEDAASLWTSPLFWGGLGAVVAVAVTAFVLSETVLADPDTVVLQGRVAP